MEQLMRPYDKEYMKMAMLKHEETFKHQVYELHRLYRIQKILMRSTENRMPNRQNKERYWDSNHQQINQNPRRGVLDLELQPAEEYVTESDGDGEVEMVEDEREIELTLGPSNYYHRRKKAETPRSLSSSCSTGEELAGHKWARKNSFDEVDEQGLRQDRVKQHSWLFQALSLNMT